MQEVWSIFSHVVHIQPSRKAYVNGPQR